VLISFSLFQWFDIEVDVALCPPNVIVPAVGLPPTRASVAAEADPAMRVVGKICNFFMFICWGFPETLRMTLRDKWNWQPMKNLHRIVIG
jgi:hypothetical protein